MFDGINLGGMGGMGGMGADAGMGGGDEAIRESSEMDTDVAEEDKMEL